MRQPPIWAHHYTLGLLFVLLILATLPVFIWALTQPTRTLTKAFFPDHCEVPKIPRAEVCSTRWTLTKDASGCRIFVCQDKLLSQ